MPDNSIFLHIVCHAAFAITSLLVCAFSQLGLRCVVTSLKGTLSDSLYAFAFLFSMMKSFSEVVYDITDYINHHIYIVMTDGLPFPNIIF